jgi:hypothetical protein
LAISTSGLGKEAVWALRLPKLYAYPEEVMLFFLLFFLPSFQKRKSLRLHEGLREVVWHRHSLLSSRSRVQTDSVIETEPFQSQRAVLQGKRKKLL